MTDLGGGPVTAIVLAAGMGTRMRSNIPKVLHPLAGRPMVAWVLEALAPLECEEALVVVGHGADDVMRAMREHAPAGLSVFPVEQPEQRGTADAVAVALALLDEEGPADDGDLLVVNGDGPLITSETLAELIVTHKATGAVASLLSARLEDPTGYGRIIRDDDRNVVGVVEERDCGPEEAGIEEVNAGFYCFSRKALGPAVEAITPDNAQSEYYLPDAVRHLVEAGGFVEAFEAPAEEVIGVNSRLQLAAAEALLRERINLAHMESGVTLIDPHGTYIDADVSIGSDTVVMPGTLLQGETSIGERCLIGPNTRIVDSMIGSDSSITESVVCEARLAGGVTVGPYAYLRPGTQLESGVHIGASVETKNAVVGKGSKIPHLSYIGDATIGEDVNIGAGTITCNFDGESKHETVIEDGARIGSDTMLVAPVTIGKGAYTAAGSAITMDVEAGELGVGRAKQHNVEGWVARKRGGKQPEGGEAD